VPASPVAQSWVESIELLGPYLPGSFDSVSPPTIRGGWRAMQSWHALRLPQRSGCSTKLWPRSTATLFARSKLVWVRKTKKTFSYPQWLPPCLLAFSHRVPIASISRQHGCYRPIGRGGPSMRGHHSCRGRSCFCRACRRDFRSESRFGMGQHKPSYQGC
jgi:hypothetical protein